ncbi:MULTISPECIES: hypothetical protein [unclassified Microbacterium]|uniref:hypothetical protein n=1 Tax=unclassified Microbacterium TaxID=2609290 RepID=UPI0034330811
MSAEQVDGPTGETFLGHVLGAFTLAADAAGGVVLGADCRDGKHAACIGDAWDILRDEATPCTCPCHHVELSETERIHVAVLEEILGEAVEVTSRGVIQLTAAQAERAATVWGPELPENFDVDGATWCGIPVEEVKP